MAHIQINYGPINALSKAEGRFEFESLKEMVL